MDYYCGGDLLTLLSKFEDKKPKHPYRYVHYKANRTTTFYPSQFLFRCKTCSKQSIDNPKLVKKDNTRIKMEIGNER